MRLIFTEVLYFTSCFTDHGAPQWSRVKSVVILIMSATLIALCSDLIADNIQELLQTSDVSEVSMG